MILSGIAYRDSLCKTAKVRVLTTSIHKKYKKVVRKFKTYLAHDPDSKVRIGQKVKISSCVKFSKKKSWVVLYD